MGLSLLACSGQSATSTSALASYDRITIGVSIWNTRDLMGSKTKQVLETAADALDVDVVWYEHEYDPSLLRISVNKLISAGCDGILFFPTEYSDMKAAIKTCDREGVYLAQYYSRIVEDMEPEIYDLSLKSPYYVGAVYEDEVENGYNLTYYLLNNGDRQIGVMCSEGDEITFADRREGVRIAVDEWNTAHPDDRVYVSQTVYAKTSTESCDEAVDELLLKMRDMDGLLVGSGNGTQVVGAMGALRDHGLSGKVDLVGTGFLNDMKKQLKHDGIYAQSGGNICNPLYAFLMVYRSVSGSQKKEAGEPGSEIKCPYIYISSPEEYEEYEKYFITTLPYSDAEIVDLSTYSTDEIAVAAGILSVRDVKTRHSDKYIDEVRERKQNAGIDGKDNGKGGGSD